MSGPIRVGVILVAAGVVVAVVIWSPLWTSQTPRPASPDGNEGMVEKVAPPEQPPPPAAATPIASRVRLKVQPPSAPEMNRKMALQGVEEELAEKGYVPGEHQMVAEDPRVQRMTDGSTLYLPSVEIARELHQDESVPLRDLEILEEVVGTYRRIYRENPVAGLNHEVTAVMTGKNEQGVALIDPSHPAINEKGELLDRWGTPFHFHGISSQVMEFRSAGPDQKFGTADDLQYGADG